MVKKKEVIIDPKTAPATIETGDVTIYYGRQVIAGLSESSNARLETEDTLCKYWIGVEYNKPESGIGYVPLTVSDDAETAHTYNYVTSSLGYIINNNITKPVAMSSSIIPNAILPNYRPTETKPYKVLIFIGCASDSLTVTVNGDEVLYDDGAYGYEHEFTNYPDETFTLTITDKIS